MDGKLLLRGLLGLALLLSLAACEVYEPRKPLRRAVEGIGAPRTGDPTQSIRDAHYKTWPKEIQIAVDNRQLRRGMTKLQVQASLRLREQGIQKYEFNTSRGPGERWLVYRTLDGWASTQIQSAVPTTLVFLEDTLVDFYR